MKKLSGAWHFLALPLWCTIVSVAIQSCCCVDAFSLTNTVPPSRGASRATSASFSGRRQRVVREFHYDPSITDCIGDGYSYCLENYYLPTQAATGALCASVGDVIAQTTERNEAIAESSEVPEYDPVRTFHYFLKGIGGGIMWSYWFDMSEPLSNSLTQSVLGTSSGEEALVFQDSFSTLALKERMARTFINIFMEQFFVSPLLFMFWDIPLPALLRGTPLRQIPNQIQSKMGPLFVANAKVWTVVNMITYNIPVEYRVLFSSCADILWQSINAGITSQEISPAMGPLPPPLEEEVPQRGRGTATILAASAQQEIL